MEIFGIGMPEIIFIVIVALIIMGPKDMEKAGRTIGAWMRKVVTSDGWRMFQQTSKEIRALPTRLMREANQELQQVNQIGAEIQKNVQFTPPVGSRPSPEVILPTPQTKETESEPTQDA
ncbi:MAG: hypothetical protein Fur002_00250 [Anaerolineales bacterium]